MFVQHGIASRDDRSDHGAEKIVLARVIMVEIAYSDAGFCRDDTHGGLGKTVPEKLLPGHIDYTLFYVIFQYLHWLITTFRR